jgi:hypothetical protein
VFRIPTGRCRSPRNDGVAERQWGGHCALEIDDTMTRDSYKDRPRYFGQAGQRIWVGENSGSEAALPLFRKRREGISAFQKHRLRHFEGSSRTASGLQSRQNCVAYCCLVCLRRFYSEWLVSDPLLYSGHCTQVMRNILQR